MSSQPRFQVVSSDVPHPARHMQLRAGDVKVDEGYQRELSTTRATRMAADWQATAPIEVSARVGGEFDGHYFVYNGQHRLAAFIHRFGKDAPIDAWVEPLTRTEEAQRFASQYVNAVRVGPFQVLRAQASTGDEHSLGVIDLMARYDLVWGQSIMAVTTLSQLFRRNPLITEITIQHLRTAWDGWSHWERPTGPVLAGLFDLLYYHGDALDWDEVQKTLVRLPPRVLMFQALGKTPGLIQVQERAVYEVLLDNYNKGRTAGRRIAVKDFGRTVGKRRGSRDPI